MKTQRLSVSTGPVSTKDTVHDQMDGAAFRNFGHKLKTTKDKSPNSWSFEEGFEFVDFWYGLLPG